MKEVNITPESSEFEKKIKKIIQDLENEITFLGNRIGEYSQAKWKSIFISIEFAYDWAAGKVDDFYNQKPISRKELVPLSDGKKIKALRINNKDSFVVYYDKSQKKPLQIVSAAVRIYTKDTAGRFISRQTAEEFYKKFFKEEGQVKILTRGDINNIDPRNLLNGKIVVGVKSLKKEEVPFAGDMSQNSIKEITLVKTKRKKESVKDFYRDIKVDESQLP